MYLHWVWRVSTLQYQTIARSLLWCVTFSSRWRLLHSCRNLTVLTMRPTSSQREQSVACPTWRFSWELNHQGRRRSAPGHSGLRKNVLHCFAPARSPHSPISDAAGWRFDWRRLSARITRLNKKRNKQKDCARLTAGQSFIRGDIFFFIPRIPHASPHFSTRHFVPCLFSFLGGWGVSFFMRWWAVVSLLFV